MHALNAAQAFFRVSFSIIAPVIIVIFAIGAYTVHSSMFDVILMLVFGVLGCFMLVWRAFGALKAFYRACEAAPKAGQA